MHNGPDNEKKIFYRYCRQHRCRQVIAYRASFQTFWMEAPPYYESVDNNPPTVGFLQRHAPGGSFNLQVYFLSSRFKHQKKLMQRDESYIQDRTIYEDV